MKKRIGVALLAAVFGAAAPNPIVWEIQPVAKKALKPGERFDVRLVAQIESGWRLYSMTQMPEGPHATRISLAEEQRFELAGAIQAEKPQITWDEILDMRRLETYEDEAAFTLPLRVSRNARAGTQKLLVNASYQACNEKMCLPPRTVTLELPVEVNR